MNELLARAHRFLAENDECCRVLPTGVAVAWQRLQAELEDALTVPSQAEVDEAFRTGIVVKKKKKKAKKKAAKKPVSKKKKKKKKK